MPKTIQRGINISNLTLSNDIDWDWCGNEARILTEGNEAMMDNVIIVYNIDAYRCGSTITYNDSPSEYTDKSKDIDVKITGIYDDDYEPIKVNKTLTFKIQKAIEQSII